MVYQYHGRFDESEKHFQECITVYKEIGYKSGEAAALLNVGVARFFRGDHERALDFFNRSLDLASQLGEKMAIAFALFRLGTAYYEMGSYQESIEYIRQSLIVMKESNAQGYFGYAFSYLGCVYAKMGDADHSIKAAYYNIKNIKKIGSDVENGRVYLGLAIALSLDKGLSKISLLRLHEIQKISRVKENTPKEYFELSIDISRKAKYIHTLVYALYAYAEYLTKLGERKHAKLHIDEVFRIAGKSKMNLIIERTKSIAKDTKDK